MRDYKMRGRCGHYAAHCSALFISALALAIPATAQSDGRTKGDAAAFLRQMVEARVLNARSPSENYMFDRYQYSLGKVEKIDSYSDHCLMEFISDDSWFYTKRMYGSGEIHHQESDGRFYKKGHFYISIDWTKVSSIEANRFGEIVVKGGVYGYAEDESRDPLVLSYSGNDPNPGAINKRILAATQFLQKNCYSDPLKGSKF